MIFCKRCDRDVETHDSGDGDLPIAIICNECDMTVGILYD